MKQIVAIALLFVTITALMPASNGAAIELGVSQRCYNSCDRQARKYDWTNAQLQACYRSCTIYR